METYPSEYALWNITVAARYLGMSVAFMRKAVRKNAIPFTRIGDKSLRFSKRTLDEWVAARTTKVEL